MPTRSLDKDPINQGLLLSIPMREGTGSSVVADVARPHHPITQVHAPSWTQLPSGLWVLDFDSAHPDYLVCPAASCADLAFTTGLFSGAIWVNLTTNTGPVIGKRAAGGNGWVLYAPGITSRGLYGSGGSATAGAIPASIWSLLGWSRTSTTTVRHYLNGIDDTTSETFASPSAAGDLEIATYSGAIPGIKGRLWNPRIWGRALSPSEHMSIFKRERHLFGLT